MAQPTVCLGIVSEEAKTVENTTEVRVRRSEQDIETLRTTQSALINRFDEIYRTLKQTRDIAAENRERLERIEDRQKLLEDIVLENRDIVRENRDILLAIADHLDLTLETPPQGPQPD